MLVDDLLHRVAAVEGGRPVGHVGAVGAFAQRPAQLITLGAGRRRFAQRSEALVATGLTGIEDHDMPVCALHRG